MGWLSVTSPDAIPKRIATLRRNVQRYILPVRRQRASPRIAKLKVSSRPKRFHEVTKASAAGPQEGKAELGAPLLLQPKETRNGGA